MLKILFSILGIFWININPIVNLYGVSNLVENHINNKLTTLTGSTISYDTINNYNLQSQLMLRSDFFNQGLSPKNYAFSMGLTPTYSYSSDGQYSTSFNFGNASVDLNSTRYWSKLWTSYFLRYAPRTGDFNIYDLTLIDFNTYTDIAKMSITSTAFGSLSKFNLENLVDKRSYSFDIDSNFLKIIFIPLIENQSPYSFTAKRLLFNFDFENAFRIYASENNLNIDIETFIYDMNFFWSNMVRYMFDLNPKTTIITKFPATDRGQTFDLNFDLFVKNGFNLYPKTLIVNFFAVTNSQSNRNINFEMKFDNISNINWDLDLSYYQYLNDKSTLQSFANSVIALGWGDWWKGAYSYSISNEIKGFNSFSTIFKQSFAASVGEQYLQYYINDINFTIYNVDDWNGQVNSPENIFEIPYMKCGVANIMGCVVNAGTYLINTFLNLTGASKIISSVSYSAEAAISLLNGIQNLFAFNITFSLMLYSILTLALIIAIGKMF